MRRDARNEKNNFISLLVIIYPNHKFQHWTQPYPSKVGIVLSKALMWFGFMHLTNNFAADFNKS